LTAKLVAQKLLERQPCSFSTGKVGLWNVVGRRQVWCQIAPGFKRANRTLLPVAPTGVAIPPRTAGFGNRDRFELNGKIGLHRAAG
jgi:hypothetical protein